MNCDNLKKVSDLINSANNDNILNHYITIYIRVVISSTCDLDNLRKEICMSRNSLRSINEHFIPAGKEKAFVIQNAKFFFDIAIEDSARWTIKKEVLKIFNNCLCQINETESHSINNRLCSNNTNYKFYLHKLIDVLSIYGDYDFQALVTEMLIRTSTKQELKKILNQLIPESKELQIKFSKINTKYFDGAVRDFLNSLNQRNNKIFSICCQRIMLGSINCDQNMDKCDGVWVDFNMVDGVVSWYTNIKALKGGDSKQELKENTWNLVTLFKDDVSTLNVQRLETSVNIDIKLNKACLSFHEEYQPIIDKASTVCFQLPHSAETNNLISNILPTVLPTKDTNNNTKIADNTPLPITRTSGKKLPITVLRKRKKYINDHEIITISDTLSRSPNSQICTGKISVPESRESDEVQIIGTQIAKQLECQLELSKTSKTKETINTSNKSVLKDKNINIPSTSILNRSNSLNRPSVIWINSESDLCNPVGIQESDIDNMSICFTSEEQLLRMANDFGAATLYLRNILPTEKRNNDKTRQTNSAISSTRSTAISKSTKNCTYKREIITKNNPNKKCLSVHSKNDMDKNSTLKLMQLLEDSDCVSNICTLSVNSKNDVDKNSTLKLMQLLEGSDCASNICILSPKDKSNLGISGSKNQCVNGVSKQAAKVSEKQAVKDRGDMKRLCRKRHMSESTIDSQQLKDETLPKEPSTTATGQRKTLKENSTKNTRKIIRKPKSKEKKVASKSSKKENRKTINEITEKKIRVKKITNKNYDVSFDILNESSHIDTTLSNSVHNRLSANRSSLVQLNKKTRPENNKPQVSNQTARLFLRYKVEAE